MSIKAMKQALEALESATPKYTRQRADQKTLGGALEYWKLEQHQRLKAITSLRQAIAEASENGLYREGYRNGYGFGEAAGKRKAIAEAQKQKPLCTAAMFDEWFLAKSGLDPKTPLYTHPQPKREHVAWEQLYPDIGKPQLEYLPASPFDISGKPQPKRHEWVNATAWRGLSDDEIDEGLLRSDYALQTAHAWRAGVVFAMTKLKEKNT